MGMSYVGHEHEQPLGQGTNKLAALANLRFVSLRVFATMHS